MTPNAWITLRQPTATPSGTGGLEREHGEQDADRVRCWATPGSVNKVITVMGELGRVVYDVRLRSSLQVAPGWRADLQPDGESEYTYRVESANRKLGHWHLVLTRE